MASKKVFLLIKGKAALDINTSIKAKDLADVYCKDTATRRKVENVIVAKTPAEEDWMNISSIEIIEKIDKELPNLEIEVIGAEDVLIEVKSPEESNKVLKLLKTIIIFIILFIGSGLTIINFYTDTDMEKTMEVIYETLTGIKNPNPYALTISYSIGLGIGVIIFFNRIISKSLRRKKEPGPMEIELFAYDKDMEDYILNDLNKSEEG
ncbi:MAG: hypothetical protein GX185_07735 [Tissierellia bacterium]|nr:hypothetical protein [Tissierellia bacterium]